jgi:hypothetical protein
MTPPLTAAELDAITAAAWPLLPGVRADFEQQVITEWQRLPPDKRGPGTLHRTIAMAQRAFLKSGPIAVSTGNVSRYGRAALRAKGK